MADVAAQTRSPQTVYASSKIRRGQTTVVDILSWAASDRGEGLFLQVGGLANEEHSDWIDQKPLQVGDEIRVEICDVESVDDPIQKRRIDAAESLDRKKEYSVGWRKNLAGRFRPIQTMTK